MEHFSNPPSETLFQRVELGKPVLLDAVNAQYEAERSVWMKRRQEAETIADAVLKEAQAEADQVLKDTQEQARHWVERSHQRAAKIEAEAEAKAAATLEAAYQEGLKRGVEEGLQSGYNQAGEETLALLQAAQLVNQQAFRLQSTVFEAMMPSFKQALLWILNEVLGYEQRHYPVELITHLLAQAKEHLELTGAVEVVIHPQHLELLRNIHPDITAVLEALHQFRFLTDETLGIHQCFILGSKTEWDISAEAQISQLLAAVQTPLAASTDALKDALPPQD